MSDKKKRGCEEDTKTPYWTDLDNNKRSSCPLRAFRKNPELYNDLLTAHSLYKAHGTMPYEGGFMNQPALYTHLISFIEYVKTKCEKIAEEKKEVFKKEVANA